MLLMSLLLGSLLPMFSAATPLVQADGPTKFRVYVGTYTNKQSKGIYLLELDTVTGKLESKGLAAESDSPSFLAIHPNKKFLYSVNEISKFEGRPSGSVTAYSIDPKTGLLTQLNRQSTGGGSPCHLSVVRDGKVLLVANYGGGSVAALPIREDGSLDPLTSFIQHHGSSVNPGRQQEPHAHSINIDLDQNFVVAADLGLDKIMVYKLETTGAKLTPNDPPFGKVEPGSGPRHFAFHPDKTHAYVINEIKSTVTVFDYNSVRGSLDPIQSISTLPDDFKGESYTAEVVVHPSGRFVYGSNRGHDSIAVFAVDRATGKLTAKGQVKTGGKAPRNFAIDPTGRFLLAEHQDSDTIVPFRIDQETGALTATGQTIKVPIPVCVKFLAIE